MVAARLIAAMLAPLCVERVELDRRGRATQSFLDPRQLVVAQRDVRSSGYAGTNQWQLPRERAAAAATRRRAPRTSARWPASAACGRRARYLRVRRAWRTA